MSFALAACQSGWQIELISNDLTQGLITSSEVKFYLDQSDEPIELVPLGQLFYINGFSLIDEIKIISEKSEITSYVGMRLRLQQQFRFQEKSSLMACHFSRKKLLSTNPV